MKQPHAVTEPFQIITCKMTTRLREKAVFSLCCRDETTASHDRAYCFCWVCVRGKGCCFLEVPKERNMPSWSRQRKNGENGEAGGKGFIFCHAAEMKRPHPIKGPLLKGRRLGIRRWPGGAACYFFGGFANVTGAAKAAQDGTAAFLQGSIIAWGVSSSQRGENTAFFFSFPLGGIYG